MTRVRRRRAGCAHFACPADAGVAVHARPARHSLGRVARERARGRARAAVDRVDDAGRGRGRTVGPRVALTAHTLRAKMHRVRAARRAVGHRRRRRTRLAAVFARQRARVTVRRRLAHAPVGDAGRHDRPRFLGRGVDPRLERPRFDDHGRFGDEHVRRCRGIMRTPVRPCPRVPPCRPVRCGRSVQCGRSVRYRRIGIGRIIVFVVSENGVASCRQNGGREDDRASPPLRKRHGDLPKRKPSLLPSHFVGFRQRRTGPSGPAVRVALDRHRNCRNDRG